MSNDEVNDFIMGGGAPSAKFEAIGTVHRGTILDFNKSSQTDIQTGEPVYWNDGRPKEQVIITIQTDERDQDIDDDDGRRRFYVKGNMQAAVRDAVRKSGAKRLEVGGMLAVQYHADGEAKKAGFNKPKLYTAEYRAPVSNVDSLIGGDTPAPVGNPLIPS